MFFIKKNAFYIAAVTVILLSFIASPFVGHNLSRLKSDSIQPQDCRAEEAKAKAAVDAAKKELETYVWNNLFSMYIFKKVDPDMRDPGFDTLQKKYVDANTAYQDIVNACEKISLKPNCTQTTAENAITNTEACPEPEPIPPESVLPDLGKSFAIP